jgi:hypothetical protein
MKYAAIGIAAVLFGMLVVMLIFQPQHFGTLLWHTYTDPSGNYSIKFPSKPEMSDKQVQKNGSGTTAIHTVYAIPNKSIGYFYSYHDEPRFATMTVEGVFNRIRDGAIRDGHGALLDEQRIEVYGRQARDVQARYGENLIVNTRLIADGQRIVILQVQTAGQKVDSKNVQTFFDSLKMLR